MLDGMISAGAQAKLDRIAEIRAQIETLEAELEQILGGEAASAPAEVSIHTALPVPQPAEATPERSAAPAYNFQKHTAGKPCCGSLGKRHKKDCPGVGGTMSEEPQEDHDEEQGDAELDPDAMDQEEEEAPRASGRRQSPAQKRDPMSRDQFDRVKELQEAGELSEDITNKTGIELEEVQIALAQRAYGMYIYERKKIR